MKGWRLIVKDRGRYKVLRDDCSCPDHCKELARKYRKTDYGYNTCLDFDIQDPFEVHYASSKENCGWRLQWVRGPKLKLEDRYEQNIQEEKKEQGES